MEKIHLIMPMAGGGTRFGKEGFQLPKPLIRLQGKPFFYWAVQSIVKYMDVEDIIFVVLQEHTENFSIDREILEHYPNARIHVIPQVLNGAVLTCCEGVKLVDDELPILFNDCDHAFLCQTFYDFCRCAAFEKTDAALLTFPSDSPCYSYVCFDQSGNITGTVEKEAVSSEAVCGAYYFRNRNIFKDAVETYLEKCSYNEFFVSGVYNVLADEGKKLCTFSTDEHISFGTPDEYNVAVSDKRLGALV